MPNNVFLSPKHPKTTLFITFLTGCHVLFGTQGFLRNFASKLIIETTYEIQHFFQHDKRRHIHQEPPRQRRGFLKGIARRSSTLLPHCAHRRTQTARKEKSRPPTEGCQSRRLGGAGIRRQLLRLRLGGHICLPRRRALSRIQFRSIPRDIQPMPSRAFRLSVPRPHS